jgi:RING finger protein 113A
MLTSSSSPNSCAVKRYAKGQTKCYACGASTGGMFNKAEKILAKMAAKNADRAEKRGKDIFGNKKDDSEGEDDGGIEFGDGDGDGDGDDD